MKRMLIAFIVAIVAAVSLPGCFVVERDHHRDGYEHRDYDRDYGRGYHHYNGF